MPVEVKTDNQSITGTVTWKRDKTDDQWTQVPMTFANGMLKAELPHQPVAGKLLYRVELQEGDQRVTLHDSDPIVIRFRATCPSGSSYRMCLPCSARFFSARGGLEYFSKEPKFRNYMYLTLGFLIVGGFILGPLMQHFSFNVWWTGWPYGTDLTDNKTAIAFLGWVVAAVALTRAKNPKRWALAAAILMILVYLIRRPRRCLRRSPTSLQRVGVDRDLHAELVGHRQAGVDRGRRGAPVFVQLQAIGAGFDLLFECTRQAGVALALEAQVHREALGGLQHLVDVPRPRRAGGGKGAGGRAGVKPVELPPLP